MLIIIAPTAGHLLEPTKIKLPMFLFYPSFFQIQNMTTESIYIYLFTAHCEFFRYSLVVVYLDSPLHMRIQPEQLPI